MLSIQLLDKTRKINRLLQNTGTKGVIFSEVCEIMSVLLKANVLIISTKGKLLAIHENKSLNKIEELLTDNIGEFIDPILNDRILNILSTKENIRFETLGFSPSLKENHMIGLIIPIDIATRRLGSMFIYKDSNDFDIDDIILGEYGSAVVGLEIMRAINEENNEEVRKKQIVKSAISTLSFSEQESVKHIFAEMDGTEGIIIASKIADRAGITRSVIVSALRKFESAGVIETRSLGMKGTYIKVLNNLLVNEIA